MIYRLVLISLLAVVHHSSGLKLPNYIKSCGKNNPVKFNECATKNGQLAIPHLMEGDRKYRIPKLNPLTITKLNIDHGPSLKIDLKDMKLFGLDKAKVKNFSVDFAKKKCDATIFLPVMLTKAKYDISGRVLILPITGNGNMNLTLNNLEFTYSFGFDTHKKGPKKEEYIRPKKGSTVFALTGLKVYFENLFNGDKLLGPETNRFLNENWKELSQDIGPSVAKALAEVIHSILTGVCELVPYREVFPDKA